MRRKLNWYRLAGLALMVAPWIVLAVAVRSCT